MDQLLERSDDTTWNLGYQHRHHNYVSELSKMLYKDRDRSILLENEDVVLVLEIIDEATYQPENLIGDMIFFVIYQHIFIH